jgi:hypothetical protein
VAKDDSEKKTISTKLVDDEKVVLTKLNEAAQALRAVQEAQRQANSAKPRG